MMTLKEYSGRAALQETIAAVAALQETKAAVDRKSRPQQTMREILRKVSEDTNVSESDLMGHRHIREFARARQLAMYKMRDAGFSYPRIGQFLNRDHTTVMHGVQNIRNVRIGKVLAYHDAELR